MSHTTYNTEGIVLGGRNVGEANRMLDLLTPDLGLVHAFARSIREERSKLRYSLQLFSHVHLSLVRGKDMWRVTGAEAYRNIFTELKGYPDRQGIIVRISSLLRKLLQGEERNVALYEAIRNAFVFLLNKSTSQEDVHAVEYLLALRILYFLGYVSNEGSFGEYVEGTDISETVLSELSPQRREMIRLINIALHEVGE